MKGRPPGSATPTTPSGCPRRFATSRGTSAIVSVSLATTSAARNEGTTTAMSRRRRARASKRSRGPSAFPFRDDLLFLDGWKDLYLPVLRMLEPKLQKGAIVLADDTKPFRRRLGAYLAYVRSNDAGYVSLDLPLGDGLEVLLWTGRAEP